MLFFVRADKGLGNNIIYARLKNSNGQYWNFSSLVWATTMSEGCKIYLDEYSDGDPLESLYMKESTIPAGGPLIQEAVDNRDGSVLGFDNNVMGELESVPTTKSTWLEKIEFIFQYLALRRTATNVLETMYKDDGTTELGTSTLTDNRATFDKSKVS